MNTEQFYVVFCIDKVTRCTKSSQKLLLFGTLLTVVDEAQYFLV